VFRVREESGRVVMKRQTRRGKGCCALDLWRRTAQTGFNSEVFREMMWTFLAVAFRHQLGNCKHCKRQNFGEEAVALTPRF
jgi:hypothetical protein